jgi:polyphenol oxidase
LFNQLLFPSVFLPYANVIGVQSTRIGGVSPLPYHSLNLGSNTADEIKNIEQNKILFTNAIGFPVNQVVRSKQVHGSEIFIASEAGYFEGYDAMITNTKGLLLAVSTADCTPVLLYDKSTQTIAAVHAGWKGTKENLVSKTILKLTEKYGTKCENVIAYIGPCIAECSFEVDADVAQYFEGIYCRFDSNKEKYFIDLKRHNKDQLLQLGVAENNIEVSKYDTYERTDLFFSHRKENGLTGRMWTAIGLVDE